MAIALTQSPVPVHNHNIFTETAPVQKRKGTTIEQILFAMNDTSMLLIGITFVLQTLQQHAQSSANSLADKTVTTLNWSAGTIATFAIFAAVFPIVASTIHFPTAEAPVIPNDLWAFLSTQDKQEWQAGFQQAGTLLNHLSTASSTVYEGSKTTLEVQRGEQAQNQSKATESLSHMWRQEEQIGTAQNSLIQRNSQH